MNRKERRKLRKDKDLIKELYSILDEESNLLILANLGKSNSYKDVMDFLQAK